MKLLLINPLDRDDAFFYNLFAFRIPLLGVYQLARYTPEGIEVKIVDESIQDIDWSYEPDLVGISCTMTYAAARAYKIADEYRKMGVPVIIGGCHASYVPDDARKHADSVVIGEPDLIWMDILEDARKGKLKPQYQVFGFPSMENLPYKRKNPLIDAPGYDVAARTVRELIGKHETFSDGKSTSSIFEMLYELILKQDYSLLDVLAAKPLGGYWNKNVIQINRGCPVNCEFCSVTTFNGRKMRHLKIDQVIADIEELVGDSSDPLDRFFFFVDDNIIGDQKFAAELFSALKGLNITWWSQSTVQLARNEKLLKLAADSGCVMTFYGLESVAQEGLKSLEKGFKTKEYVDIIKKTHDNGIAIVTGAFVFGLDTDTKDVFEKTAEFCIENSIDVPQFSSMTPFVGTRLFQRMKLEGRILTYDWSKYTAPFVTIKPTLMTPKELLEGLITAYAMVYNNTSIRQRLSKVRHLPAYKLGHVSFMNHNSSYIVARIFGVSADFFRYFCPPYEGKIKRAKDVASLMAI